MFPKHLFLDLDGTLFRSGEDIRHAWLATLEELNLPCPQFDRVFRIGPSLQAMAEELFPGKGLGPKITSVFKRHYDASPLDNTVPYPGVDDWLRSLSASGHWLGILTNKRLAPTWKLVRRHGWESLFAEVLGCDSFNPPAPSKAIMLESTLKRLGIEPSDAAMVGDTPGDIQAGKSAGTLTVACNWGYAPLDELRLEQPDVILDLSDLRRLAERGSAINSRGTGE